jgi:2-dehydropantoate 2-reductase
MNDLKPLSVLVFGAGAIGTYVGGSLIQSGQRVVFIEQASVKSHLCQSGLRLDVSIDKHRDMTGALVIPPTAFDCVSSPAGALEKGPFDVAIFAMKSFDTAAALEGLKPFAEKMPPILCLQNGVDNEPAIAAVLGADHVIAGTVTCSIARSAPGDIVLEKARGIGVAGGHPLSAALVDALNAAKLNAVLFPRAADMKWSKLLMNLPASATSAILDMSPAEVFSNIDLFHLEMRLSQEAQAVMAAEGAHPVDLPGTPVRLLAMAARLPGFIARPLMVKAVGGGRGGKMPSFHIDLHAGRKQSEVEWLHGAVVRHGEKLGVPTPVSRLLTETLLSMVRTEIPISEFSRQPDKLIGMAGKN